MEQIALRNATRDDWEAIKALHVEHQRKQGTDYELPYLFGEPHVRIVLVGCDAEGKIHNCIYVEAVAEMRTIGCDAKATAFSRRAADALCYLLKGMGYRYLECYVPQQLKKYISKPLKKAGFVNMEERLAYFSRDLRGKL